MLPATQTAAPTTTKKTGGGKGGKKNSRHKLQKHQRDPHCGSANDQQQQHPQCRVPPTGNEPELELTGVEQHIGCSTCVVEIPCDAPMCCLTKLACQRLECGGNVCNSLEDYSKRAKELKDDISSALEKNTFSQSTDQPIEVIKLKENIQKLSALGNESQSCESILATQSTSSSLAPEHSNKEAGFEATDQHELSDNTTLNSGDKTNVKFDNQTGAKINLINNGPGDTSSQTDTHIKPEEIGIATPNLAAATTDTSNSNKSYQTNETTNNVDQPKSVKGISKPETNSTANEHHSPNETIPQHKDIGLTSEFEPLNNVNLDMESKYLAIISALKPHFKRAPHLLEPISHKLATMSEEYRQLAIESEKQRQDNQRLEKIKQKLESICRELQKSNNAIRVESLDLIKVEQGKTKEQNTKIQSTLSGVIKLFDENQQRNMSLRQENQELQIKLKSLLDHCDNWEKSVETAMRQRDIENRLIKTELAKANLMKTEEKEKFLGEKQELLQILSMMQEQQHKIEGQEAKLRSDLSTYASKYDECQAVISKGMSRFQLESRKMLQQIDKSKQDYKVLLSKYESSNRRMVQLLEEKKCWDRAMSQANKKIDTLERLCRALSGRKLDSGNKSLDGQNNVPKLATNKNKNSQLPKHVKNQAVTSNKKFDDTFSDLKLNEPGKTKNGQDSLDTQFMEPTEPEVTDSSTVEIHLEPQSDKELVTTSHNIDTF